MNNKEGRNYWVKTGEINKKERDERQGGRKEENKKGRKKWIKKGRTNITRGWIQDKVTVERKESQKERTEITKRQKDRAYQYCAYLCFLCFLNNTFDTVRQYEGYNIAMMD